MARSVRPIRHFLWAAAAVLACVNVAFGARFQSGSHPEKKHEAKRQVELLEEEWRVAQLAGDVATMDRMLSDDYIGISMTGQVSTKAQQLDRVRNHKVVIHRVDLSDMKVKLIGSIAIVTSRAEVEGINESGPVRGTFRYTRVYQRLPSGAWKITSFEATRIPSPKSSRDQPASEPAAPPGGSMASRSVTSYEWSSKREDPADWRGPFYLQRL
ncbi:MAG TPA: nuclear transport factor 2 family protein [Edaphobacter sp.]|jgi:ketosteroid isomerase-like protein|nr:nuclear transport factor 2 family protein [Edaphobacter sp.]